MPNPTIIRKEITSAGTAVDATWERVSEAVITNTTETRAIINDALSTYGLTAQQVSDIGDDIIAQMISAGTLP